MNRSLFPAPVGLPPLRWYQTKALDEAGALVAAGRQSVLVQLATGLGKTRLAVEACVRHVALGGVPMFVAPRRELVAQAMGTLERAGLELGHDAHVRTIQELTTRGASVPPVTLVVLDEARHYVADEWSKLRGTLPDAVYLGLDATPERADGRGLGGMFERIVQAITMKQAIAEGFLAPCEIIRPDHALEPGELAQDPLDVYLAKAPGSAAVVFCHSVEAAQLLACRFNERGVTAAAVWGEMMPRLRDRALADFEAGKLQVLTNMHLLTEGWDCTRVETVILARSFPTVGGMLQAAGRGLRPHPGKTRCLLVDLTGCTHEHGDVDDDREWHLEGRAIRKAEKADVRYCPICGHEVPDKVCPQCAYAGDEMKKRKPRVLGLPVERFARERAAPEEKQLKALAKLLRAARAMGRHEGWAMHVWSAKYGRVVTPEMKREARRLA